MISMHRKGEKSDKLVKYANIFFVIAILSGMISFLAAAISVWITSLIFRIQRQGKVSFVTCFYFAVIVLLVGMLCYCMYMYQMSF